MKRINKFLALLICAVMIFSIIPVEGFASETETADPSALTQPEAELTAASGAVEVTHDGVTTYYDSLQAAFDGFAPSNNTYGGTYVVTLLDDTAGFHKNLQYPTATLDITLDLNGHTITGPAAKCSGGCSTCTVCVNVNFGSNQAKGSVLTIKDSSGNNSGKITGGKGGVKLDGTDCTLNFTGGTITGNHGGSKGGGIFMGAKSFLNMTGGVITGNSVQGTSSANSGYGGGVLANYGSITSGVITGNVAYKGSHLQTGRGGGVCTEITRTSGYSTLTIANGVVYGNTAENAGDDVMAQGNGNVKFSLSIGTENWYIDGWNGTKAGSGGGQTDRYNAENPVAYTDGGFTDVKNKTVGLKYVAPTEPEKVAPAAPSWENTNVVVIFECMTNGEITSHGAASMGFTIDEKYCTVGEVYENADGKWACDVTVDLQKYYDEMVGYADEEAGLPHRLTNDVEINTRVMTAIWDEEEALWIFDTVTFETTCEPEYVAKLESTGEKFVTLQAAIDAASALMVDADNENQTVTLLDDIKESVQISWVSGSTTVCNFGLTIDLNGHTVTGNGGSVFVISRTGSANTKVMTVTFNDSVGTGVVTGGNNTYGGAVYNSNAKGKINIVVNGGTWTGNAATSSGGAISSNYTTSTQVTINGGTFTGNTAGSNGGAIYARNLYITGGEITGNSANSGGGVYVFTAASTILDMTGGKIYGNTATTDGDDIIWRANKGNTSTAYLKLLDAATMGVENVDGWYLDASGARYSEDNAVEFENYAKYTTLNSRIALKAAEKILVAPEAPDKYGNNVTPELINVICDSDKNHEPMTIKWQHQSTKVRDWVSGVVWSDEYNTWIVPIRIDSISTYYVWMHFEEAYNDISHDLVPDAPLPEGEYHIDTYLKWDEEKQLWVTLDEKPIDVHVACKTIPDVPSAAAISRRGFQIQVKGDMDGDGIFGENGLENDGVWELFATTIPAEYYEDMVVYGSREEGFFIDVTVTLEDGDIFITNWIEKRAPGQKYSYNWEMTQKTITFTLAYDGSLTGTLYGDDASYWVLASNGEIFGKVGEAFVRPSMPEAPEQANVTDKLVAVICDSDGDRHETVYGKWYPLGHCETTSDIVWDNELGAWTVDVQIGSLYIMYVDQLEDANNGIVHELVEDITCVDTKLVWNTEEELWYPVEAVELHTTCRTAPLAPVHNQLASYQVKVYGDVNGEEKAYTTYIPEGAYTVSEVYGSREEGFFVDVTFALEEDDIYQQNWLANRYPGGSYEYDWSKTPKTVTYTLKYNGSLTGTLYGNRHAVNTNYDWVLLTNGKHFGVVAEAYLELAKFILTLDPNGGTVDPATIDVTFGKTIGELPEATRTNYIFVGWFDEEGNEVTAETVYTVAGDSTVTAQWIQYPGSSSTNVTKELFTIQCTVNHEHAWLCNWFGSHVSFVKNSIKWNEELGRWEAQCKIGSSMLSQINSTQPKKNYFGGITHHYDVTNYTFDLYYDPNFTGLNSQSKEVTGMWLPVQEYVVPVYCYTEPAAPNMAKITSNVIWMRDAANTKNYLRSKLISDTYTVGQMYQKDGAFYVDLTINDLSAYIDAFEAKFGEGYMVGDWTENNTLEDFVFILKYTGSTTDYKQDGTGWSIDWPTTTEKNNARTLWLTKQYTVTYTDGAEGAIFENQEFTVFAMSETAKDKFAATATPAYEAPARTGYTFAGWTPEVAETVTADATYTAVWTANEYTLTLDANKGEVDPATVTVTFDAAIGTLPVPTRTGYTFAGWFDAEGKEVTAETVYTIDGDSTVTAKWTANEYTLTLDANKGEVDPATVTVTFDAAIGTLPVPTRTGYTFAGWFDAEGKEVTAETVYTIDGDSTVTAKWTANEYTLTLDANGGAFMMTMTEDAEVITTLTITVVYDQPVGELPVPERAGYTFNGWFDEEGNEVTADTVYTTAGDMTVTAKWTANKYTITLNPNYGKVDPKSLEATYDEAIGKLPKPTREGFIFTFWRTEDGTMVTEETIYNFAGDITLYAEWRTASPADSPATGDGMILFAFVTMLISAGALLFLMERKRRVQA